VTKGRVQQSALKPFLIGFGVFGWFVIMARKLSW
jgi:hypothetical protein